MHPRVIQLSVSPGGVPKRAVLSARVTHERLIGDDWNDKKHHGLAGQAVLLVSGETIEELKAEGFPVFPGALGENLTTLGLNYREVRPGQIYRIGEEVEIRITKPRRPCRTLAVYGEGIEGALFDQQMYEGNPASPKWGRSGFYAEVLTPGTIQVNDPIEPVTRAGTPTTEL